MFIHLFTANRASSVKQKRKSPSYCAESNLVKPGSTYVWKSPVGNFCCQREVSQSRQPANDLLKLRDQEKDRARNESTGPNVTAAEDPIQGSSCEDVEE